jgi:hypothetical protein
MEVGNESVTQEVKGNLTTQVSGVFLEVNYGDSIDVENDSHSTEVKGDNFSAKKIS